MSMPFIFIALLIAIFVLGNPKAEATKPAHTLIKITAILMGLLFTLGGGACSAFLGFNTHPMVLLALGATGAGIWSVYKLIFWLRAPSAPQSIHPIYALAIAIAAVVLVYILSFTLINLGGFH